MATKVRVPKRRFLVTLERNGKMWEYIRYAYSGQQAKLIVAKAMEKEQGFAQGAYVGHMEVFELE